MADSVEVSTIETTDGTIGIIRDDAARQSIANIKDGKETVGAVDWENVKGHPTKVSEFENDKNYQTDENVDNTLNGTLYAGSSTHGGPATSAEKLTTARTITLGGAAAGSGSFDGSANSTINVSSLDATKLTGIVSITNLPPSVVERMSIVKDDTERLALTKDTVQDGDVVKVQSSGLIYYVVDDDKLNEEAGYEVFKAGTAASVPWGGVTGKPSSYPPSSHTHTKSQITDFPSSLPNPSNLTMQIEGSDAAVYNGGTSQTFNVTKSSLGLDKVNNTADADKSVKYAASAGTVNGHTINSDVPAGAKFTDTTYSNATASSNGLMSAADKKAIDREFFRMLPKGGTHIPPYADLNTVQYIKIGTYYNPAIAETLTMKNCPAGAFIMYVLSPLSETYDDESTRTWVYRLRIFVEYSGNIFVQLVSSGDTAGSFTYNPWVKMTNANDLDAVSNTINTHISNKSNPHGVTKAQIGLGNVDNTADKDKSVKYATSADTVDGLHEYSFLRYRDATSTNGAETLWNQIGIREYDGALPSGLSGLYTYGAVVSLPGSGPRFDLYYNHHASANGDGLYYRTGWGTDKKGWVHLIDSQSIGSQSVNYANSAGTVNGHTINSDVPANVKWDEINGGSKTAKYTLAASNWQGTSAPYTYDLGPTYGSNAIIGFDSAVGNTTQLEAARAADIQGSSTTKIYAYGDKPTVDIPIVIIYQ